MKDLAESSDVIERQAFLTATMRGQRYEMKDRLKASELLGGIQGDFVARIDTPVDGVIATLALMGGWCEGRDIDEARSEAE